MNKLLELGYEVKFGDGEISIVHEGNFIVYREESNRVWFPVDYDSSSVDYKFLAESMRFIEHVKNSTLKALTLKWINGNITQDEFSQNLVGVEIFKPYYDAFGDVVEGLGYGTSIFEVKSLISKGIMSQDEFLFVYNQIKDEYLKDITEGDVI